MITDVSGRIEYVNQTFEKVTGYSRDEVFGRNPRLLQSGNTPPERHTSLWRALARGGSWEGEFHNRKKSGELYWEYAHISPILAEDGSTKHFLGIKEDITLRKQQNDKILHQARYDLLTELPNRLLSLSRLEQMIARGKRTELVTAVLFIDLDDFKKVNDTLGHETGDKVLVEAAARLCEGLRAEDTVGRFGGDEFIVLLGDLKQASDASAVASDILKRLEAPFLIEDNNLLLTASIGIAAHPQDGSRVGDLLRKADAAMYHAKNQGRADYAFYTPQLNLDVQRRVTVERHMAGALERGEFSLCYQPQVDLESNELTSLEVLLRWHSPVLGEVLPDEFIPIAEHNGMIVALGRFVMNESLPQVAQWRHLLPSSFRLAVNLSPRQFRDRQLAGHISHALASNGMSPDNLELEITEGVLMLKNADIDGVLKDLLGRGISLAMDDFGTGYSSLSYLRAYPFHTLKIDRGFTRDVIDDEADRALVVAIIAMAHSLGLKVVAEGVETRAQHQLLKQIGCDLGQGYFYSKPLPADQLNELLQFGTVLAGAAES